MQICGSNKPSLPRPCHRTLVSLSRRAQSISSLPPSFTRCSLMFCSNSGSRRARFPPFVTPQYRYFRTCSSARIAPLKGPPWTWPQPGSPCRWARRTLGRWRMGIWCHWCHCQANLDGWNQDRVIFLRAIRQGYLRPELQQDQDGEGHSSSLLMSIIRTRKERGIFEFPSLPASVSTWGTQSRR